MAKLSLNDLKPGVIFKMNDEPYLILSSNFVRMAQRKPVRQAKVRSLVSGKVLGMNFLFNADYEEADVERTPATFLFREDNGFVFMDGETFDQFTIPLADMSDQGGFLSDGMEVSILRFEGKPISVELPKKVTLTVTETLDATRGDTAQGGVMKDATLSTGHVIKVPLFIKQGDGVIVNTDTGEYVERA